MSASLNKKQLLARGRARVAVAKSKKSSRDFAKIREHVLEKSKKIRTHPAKWDVDLLIGVVDEWVDDQNRVRPLSNSTVVERMFAIVRVLIQLGNDKIDSPENKAVLVATVNSWSKDRIKGVKHPPKKKAIRLAMSEFSAISKHIAFIKTENKHNQRLHDVRRLVLCFTCASGARAKDVYHLLPIDAEMDIINGVQVLKFKQRYSKSNTRGDKLAIVALFASDKKPWLCPVRMWKEFIIKYASDLEPTLSILQLPNVGHIWREKSKPKTGVDSLSEAYLSGVANLSERLSYSIPAVVNGWKAAARSLCLGRACKVGAHSPRNTVINNGYAITNQDSILTELGGWKHSSCMLSEYRQFALAAPENPPFQYSQMTAQEIDSKNHHAGTAPASY